MPLQKDITMPNQLTLGFHKILKLETEGDNLVILVGSWKDESQYKTGVQAVWNSREAVPMPQEIKDIASIALAQSSTFLGATEVPDALDGIEAVRLKTWVKFKNLRNSKEYAPVTTPKGMFDADPDSQRRIIGAGVLAIVERVQWLTASMQQIAEASNVTLSDIPTTGSEWTLYDNSAVELTPDDLLFLGQAMGLQIKQAHAEGRVVRSQIESADSISDLNAVQWPTS